MMGQFDDKEDEEDRIETLYTWKDVERKIKLHFSKHTNQPPEFLAGIDVYPKELVITVNQRGKEKTIQNLLNKIFKKNYEEDKDRIHMDKFDRFLDVKIEVDLELQLNHRDAIKPLFKDVVYSESAYDEAYIGGKQLENCPVVAFHSYKGGVGRTLSLLAFAKAWSDVNQGKKLLIVDSDMEAPGLTWLMQDEMAGEESISYLDFLELVQSEEIQEDKTIQGIADLIAKTTIPMDTGKVITEHFFLPTYRYEEQILEIYSNPESVASGHHSRYILAELLSKIGNVLGASAVLVDLRAGLSEFSAPLIFDPRVKKYIVTSTSLQSVQGTKILLGLIRRGLPISEDGVLPEILLTMIPEGLDITDIKSKLIAELDDPEKEENISFTDTMLTELPFASELIHLPSLKQIMKKLDGRDFYKNIYGFVMNRWHETESDNYELESILENREEIIRKIHALAGDQVTAEGEVELPVLQTKAIRNLLTKYSDDIPQAVILGAKGAGKTFLFRSMLSKKTWNAFMEGFGVRDKGLPRTYIFPLIAPKDSSNYLNVIKETVAVNMERIAVAGNDLLFWHENASVITNFKKEEHDEDEWKEKWLTCIAAAFGDTDLSVVDRNLQENNQRVVFVMDGLEKYFETSLDDNGEQNAISGLIRGVVEELKIRYRNIGLIVFLRKDLASNAITTNYTQFESQYRSLMLNWSHEEALRMALWMVSKAVPEFCQGIDLENENVSGNVIAEKLNELWGVKLGKNDSNEAYSSRWILAALSDFNSQLQARDIIRFLKYATENVEKSSYTDRIIVPKEIRRAVGECSNEKIAEIVDEIAALKPIFEKMKNMPKDKKELPFKADTFNWNAKQENILKQEGFLIVDDDKYYLPEIVRYALGFKYKRGARPKVLSLLLKNNK